MAQYVIHFLHVEQEPILQDLELVLELYSWRSCCVLGMRPGSWTALVFQLLITGVNTPRILECPVLLLQVTLGVLLRWVLL